MKPLFQLASPFDRSSETGSYFFPSPAASAFWCARAFVDEANLRNCAPGAERGRVLEWSSAERTSYAYGAGPSGFLAEFGLREPPPNGEDTSGSVNAPCAKVGRERGMPGLRITSCHTSTNTQECAMLTVDLS